MPTFIPCRATPRVHKRVKSKTKSARPLLNHNVISPSPRNYIQVTVKLLDASEEIDKFVGNCKELVTEIGDLPKGSNTRKKCNELTNMIDHFDAEIACVIKEELIPQVRSVGSTGYVHRRLKNAAKRSPLSDHYSTALVYTSPYRPSIKKPRRELPSSHVTTRLKKSVQSPKPPPKYTPKQACEHYLMIQKDKTKQMEQWLTDNYIPSKSQFYKALKNFEVHKSPPLDGLLVAEGYQSLKLTM